MADGSRVAIEEVELGDRVLATDPETGETGPERVTATITGQGEKHLVEVTVDTDGDRGAQTESVTATGEPPFWVPNRDEWVDAADLQAGDRVRTAEGEQRLVTSIRTWTALQRVHNLTINNTHTYYVALNGHDETLVHNVDPECWPDGGLARYEDLNQGRATGMTARVTKGMLPDTEGSPAAQSIKPPGFIDGISRKDGGHGHARGHLLANKLGGNGDIPENLTTLHQVPVNTPRMSNYERQVKKAVQSGSGPVVYRVKPVYKGSNGMSEGVTMMARDASGNTLFPPVTVLNRLP
ncbi:DNA/RNA non-specific endonuclease [Actinopolyspora mzabensis]|uniref:DNA/RNA non-specific endonuclease n=1 Tax=Actinopolyspora mzabensis TaxID=995066 RepID=A0A1G8W2A2_ACTMZ|nr:DNA/RNA non-specific endonuclease [Actinopolyspora mzabensis]